MGRIQAIRNGVSAMVETSGRAPSQFGDIWSSGFFDPLRTLTSKVADFFAPAAESSSVGEYYEVDVELPGVAESDINISVDHNVLMITGEKKHERKEEGRTFFFSEFNYGRFQRSFRLPGDADQDKIDATHKDGVLTIRIAKTRPSKPGGRKIEIHKS